MFRTNDGMEAVSPGISDWEGIKCVGRRSLSEARV
jgi:hypothetical protein